MRIGIQTWGSHGDMQPFISLAGGLAEAGHEVTLCVTVMGATDYSAVAESMGFSIEHLQSPVSDNEIGRKLVEEKGAFKEFHLLMKTQFVPVEEDMYAAAERLCQNNELLIAHCIHYPLMLAAQKYSRPYVSVMLSHENLPTQNQPPLGFPNLGRRANKLFWWLSHSFTDRAMRRYADNLQQKMDINLGRGVVSKLWASPSLNLIAVSSDFCIRQDDWDPNHQVCGFLNSPNTGARSAMPDDLQEFLNSGPAPVFMTFGSWGSDELEPQQEYLYLFSEAAKLAGVRAIIQSPSWQKCELEESNEIFYINYAEHDLIFPHCLAIIHHGGAGTTQSACKAGVPSIIVAHYYEQKVWAAELNRLGIASGVLFRRNANSQSIAKKINFIKESRNMQENARVFSKSMKTEDGVAKAVRIINERFQA